MRQTILTLIRIVSFALTLLLWKWLLQQSFAPFMNFVCIVAPMIIIFPIVWIGRKLLDLKPTIEQVQWVTTFVHAVSMMLFGIAIIKAIQTANIWRGFIIPIPKIPGIVLLAVAGAFMLFTVITLALRGFGAPFAIALSRRLATDWLYSRTRNPMVLAVLACLLAAGLYLQSTLFIVWVILLVTPAWIIFIKIYEEKELEIRFGEAYKEYKAKTSFLWPGKTRQPIR